MPPGFDQATIARAFTYHKPTEEQKNLLVNLRGHYSRLGQKILDFTPPGPEQTLAIRKLEESSMWANKAIVLEDPEAADLRPEAG